MANRYHGDFIVVDTTDTQLGGHQPTGGQKGNLRITGIQWLATPTKAIADTNKLTIEYERDGGDIVIAVDAQLTTTGARSVYYQREFNYKPWIVPGLYIEDIDGGELIIWLD